MYHLLFVFAVCCLTFAVGDNTCSRPSSKPKIQENLMPKLDDVTFSANVEFYSKENSTLTSMKVYYHEPRGIIHLTILANGTQQDVYYLYQDNEILTFKYDEGGPLGMCVVDTNLSSSPQNFMVGGVYVHPMSNDTVNIPPLLHFLHFAGKDADGQDVYPSFVRKTKIRDKDVNEFTSCQQWLLPNFPSPNNKITANVTHYFSVPEWSNPPSQIVPVEIRVVGQLGDVPIEHSYSYFNVNPHIPEKSLETPDRIACPGRINDKPFPTLPSFIKMNVEDIDDLGGKIYFNHEEIYDFEGQISVVKYPGANDEFNQFGQITVINDYKSGISYRINQESEECDIRNITNRFLSGDNDFGGQELNRNHFFIADDASFSYLGVKQVRGMFCDVWVGNTRTSYLGNVTVEWFFALKGTQSAGSDVKYRIPVKSRFWGYREYRYEQGIYSLDRNIFHVDYTKVLYNTFTIKPCLLSSAKNRFQLVFEDAAKEFTENVNMQDFKWAATRDISNTADVSVLRISDIRLFFNNTDTVVEFDMLDKPPDVNTNFQGRSLQNATLRLEEKVRSGSFQLQVSKINLLDTRVFITASKNAFLHPDWNI